MIAALAARPDSPSACRRSTSPTLHDAVVILDGDTALLRLGDERLRRRGCSSTSTWRRRCASASTAIDYVDLRFDERLYVRPVEGRTAHGEDSR